MHRIVLTVALLAPVCYAVTPVSSSAGSAKVAFPSGAMQVRPQCYGDAEDESSAVGMKRAPSPSPSAGYRSGGAASKPSMAPSGPVASAPEAVRTRETADKKTEERPAPAREKAKGDSAMSAADSASLGDAMGGGVVAGGLLGGVVAMEEAEPEPMDLDDAVARGPAGPALDWGATTWLSNDDSMSLASAQHVLWATQNGQRPALQHIRPHELLNYFSFDAVAPTTETFAVTASARQTGPKEMTLALALKGAAPPRAPLDLSFLVDRSGSMSAEGRMEYTRRALKLATEQLNAGDRVDLVLFDGSPCTVVENYVVGRDDPAAFYGMVDRLAPRGSTDLDSGLKEAYSVQRRKSDTAGRARRVMVITDAQLNTGNVNEHVVSDVAKAYKEDNIRLTGVGVGRGFNDSMLDKLTEKGAGAYVYLGSEAVVDRLFGPGFDALVQTIAHDVRFGLDLPDSLAITRFYGEESSTVKEDVQAIDYYSGTTQLFLQDVAVSPKGYKASDPVKLMVEWTDPASNSRKERVFHTTVGDLVDGPSRNVDKGRALMAWTDMLMEDAMGGDACGAPVRTWAERAGYVVDDAEIAYVDTLVRQRCPAAPMLVAHVEKPSGVQLKLRVDADQPIAEVALACGSFTQRGAMASGTNVVRFDAVPGACQVTIQGAVPMVASVEVPKTGGDVRCVVRGGRLSCGG